MTTNRLSRRRARGGYEPLDVLGRLRLRTVARDSRRPCTCWRFAEPACGLPDGICDSWRTLVRRAENTPEEDMSAEDLRAVATLEEWLR